MWWLVGALSSLSAGELAASPGDPDLQLIESTERGLDPLGLDEATGTGLDEAARKLPATPPPAPPPLIEGQVLRAPAPVVESAHVARIELEQGVAVVEEKITLLSRDGRPSEIAYRLARPRAARLVHAEVCRANSCRAVSPAADARAYDAAFAPSSGAGREPALLVESIEDRRGSAFALAVAPVAKEPVVITISYVVPAELHAGSVQLELPARAFDARTAPLELIAHGAGLVLDGPERSLLESVERPIKISAQTSARPLKGRSLGRCGKQLCERLYEAQPTSAPERRETWLLIDSSPSMEGPARSRAPLVLAALLALLPEGTPLRVFGFGASAGELPGGPSEQLALSQVIDALYEDRGAGSRSSAALELARDALNRARPRLVIVSDGLLDEHPRELEALASARRHGATPWLIALGEQPLAPRVVQTFGSDFVLSPRAEADRVQRGELPELLERVLAKVVARPLQPGLWAGEQRVRVRRLGRAGGPLTAWLSAVLEPEPPLLWTTPASPVDPLTRVPRFSGEASAAPADTGMPKESVLELLRTQLIPRARACLRSDRRGRADHAVALTFEMLLLRREIHEARIVGRVAPPLERCLLEVLPDLRLPWFTGRLRVRYPIHTEREALPPTIALEPELERSLDHTFGPAPPP